MKSPKRCLHIRDTLWMVQNLNASKSMTHEELVRVRATLDHLLQCDGCRAIYQTERSIGSRDLFRHRVLSPGALASLPGYPKKKHA